MRFNLIKMSVHLYRLLLLCLCSLLLTSCAHSDMATSCDADNLSSTSNEDEVLIFIYPQAGVINQGKYFHLPATETDQAMASSTRIENPCLNN